MTNPVAGLPPRLLRTSEAARYLGLSNRTLERHRNLGTGPTYRKLGGTVLYTLDDLKLWIEENARRMSSNSCSKVPKLIAYAGKAPHT
jgi:excisionase family DNA binding protein